jgi:hypothetical protein
VVQLVTAQNKTIRSGRHGSDTPREIKNPPYETLSCVLNPTSGLPSQLGARLTHPPQSQR